MGKNLHWEAASSNNSQLQLLVLHTHMYLSLMAVFIHKVSVVRILSFVL